MTELEIFEAAQQIVDPAAQAAFVDQSCAGNEDLRRSVMELLQPSGQVFEILNAPLSVDSSVEQPTINYEPQPQEDSIAKTIVPPGGTPPHSSEITPTSSGNPDDVIGRVINGRYKLIEEIGEGGQGTVYKAEDLTFHRGSDDEKLNEKLQKYNRYVAVKLIRTSMSGDKVLQRFLAERQALAMMDHPHIAKFLDAGHTPQDGVYFVMELVKGLPIAKYCDQHQLSLDDRLKLMVQVSKAIQHAHQKGIIHRDLKPGNILVAEYDGKPSVMVIDFGLAKALGEPLTDHSVNTGFFGVAGTIQYMAPEQATFNQLDIDPRADVYSMTVVLYELLTGTTPHSSQELKLAGVLEQLRMVREKEPPKASHRLSSSAELPSVAAYRQSEPRKLIGILRRELDAVLMKGLEKDRNRRYDSPNDFADDLERFLNREPVKAVPPSFAYRTSKYVRKHWKPLLVATGFATILIASLLCLGLQEYRRAEAVRDKELSDLKAKDEERERRAAQDREKTTKLEAIFEIRDATARVTSAADRNGYFGTMGRLVVEEGQRSPGWAERSWELLKKASAIQSPLRDDADIRSAAATVLIADEYQTKPDWPPHLGQVRVATYSPSGEVLALAPYSDVLNPKPRLLLLDTKTGNVKQTLISSDNWASPDEIKKRTVAALRSRFDFASFLESDDILLAVTAGGRIVRWDLKTTPPTSFFANAGSDIGHVYLTPDKKWCVTRHSSPVRLVCWDTTTLKQVGMQTDLSVTEQGAVIVNNNSMHVQTVNQDVHLLSLPDLKVHKPTFPVIAPFHPSGEFYLTKQRDSLHAMSWPENVPLFAYRIPEKETPLRLDIAANAEMLRHSKFSQSGEYFSSEIATERGNEIRIWNALGGESRWSLPVPAGTVLKWDGHEISPDSNRTAIISNEDVVQFSRIRPDLAFYRASGHPNGVRYVRASPDRSRLAVLGERTTNGNDSLAIWKTGETPKRLHSPVTVPIVSLPAQATDILSFSPDGCWLATAGYSNASGVSIIVSNCAQPATGHTITVPNEDRKFGKSPLAAGAIAGLGWSSRGELIAAIDYELFAWNIDGTTPRQIARENTFDIAGSQKPYASVAMTGSDIGWAVTIPSELRTFRIAGDRIEITHRVKVPGDGNSRICRIAPSQRWLAIGKADGTVVLYDTAKQVFGTPLTETHRDVVQAMVWLNDRQLATGSRDGMFALWNIDDEGKPTLWYRVNLKAPISDIATTHDNQAAYIACANETSLRVLDFGVIDRELHALLSNTSPVDSSIPFPVIPKKLAINRANTQPVKETTVIERPLKPLVSYSAEREAAKWVLSAGGQVTLIDTGGKPLPLLNNQLPEGDFQLETVTLIEPKRLDIADLTKLSACRRMTTLSLSRVSQLTDVAMANLKGTRIRNLNIDGCSSLTDESMKIIATMDALESLNLNHLEVTDTGVAVLEPLTRLRNVNASTTRITDVGLKQLAKACPKITHLSLERSPAGQQTAACLREFRNLEWLNINGNQFTDDAVTFLNSIPSFKLLQLTVPLSDATVSRLNGLKTVHTVGLNSAQDEKAAKLSANFISDTLWPAGLQSLYFNGTAVSPRDEDFQALAKLPSLNNIGIGYAKGTRSQLRFTHAGILKLRDQRSDITIGVGTSYWPAGTPIPQIAPQE